MPFNYGSAYETAQTDKAFFSQAFFDTIKAPQLYDRTKDPDIIIWDKLTHEERFYRGLEDPVFFCKHFLHDEDGIPSFNFHFTAFQYAICAFMTGRCEFLENFGRYPTNPDRPKENYQYFQRKFQQFMFNGAPVFFKTQGGKWRMRTGGVEVFSILVPRGCGKTTIGRGMSTRDVAYGTARTILLTSRTQTHCEDSLNSIVSWLSTPRFKEYFGERIPPNKARLKNTADRLETLPWNNCQTTILTASPATQIRGLNIKNSRPDKILIDDPNSTYARQEDSTEREKVNNWYLRDLRPALSRSISRPNIYPRIVCLATAIHEESLGVKLHKFNFTMSMRFSAQDEDNDVLCTNLTPDRLRHYHEEAKEMGEVSAFRAEFMNQTEGSGSKIFDPDNFCYVPHCDLTGMRIFIGVDPAFATTNLKKADFTSVSVIGTKNGFNMVLIENIQTKGNKALDTVNMIINIAKNYGAEAVGIEANGGQALLIDILEIALADRRKTHEVIHEFKILPIKHYAGKAKRERIEIALQQATANRSLSFRCLNKQDMNSELKKQFEDFPYARNDDGLDSTEIAYTMATVVRNHAKDNTFIKDEHYFGKSDNLNALFPSPKQMQENKADRQSGLII